MGTVEIHRLQPTDLPVRFDRFEILELLGEGGMARVYRAEQLGQGGFRKKVALKVITDKDVRDDARLRRSLLHEARLVGGQLNHHNLVDIFEYGETEGQAFIVMQLVEGVSMDEVLDQIGPPPAPLALRIAIGICRGLAHAHKADIVHRDLKPSNVILSRDGIAKLMDLGIGKNLRSAGTTSTGTLKGTPFYMAPEQVHGQGVDKRTDVFALGAVLYELFTGTKVFEGDGYPTVIWGIMNIEERLLSGELLDPLRLIDEDLAALIHDCLRHAPDDEDRGTGTEAKKDAGDPVARRAAAGTVTARELVLDVPILGQEQGTRLRDGGQVGSPNWIGYYVGLEGAAAGSLTLTGDGTAPLRLALDSQGDQVPVQLIWCRCVEGCADAPATEDCVDGLGQQAASGSSVDIGVDPERGVGPLALLSREEIE